MTAAYVLLVIRGLEHVAVTEIQEKLHIASIEVLTLQPDPSKPRMDVERGEAAVGKILLHTTSPQVDVKSLCSIQACLAYVAHASDIDTDTPAGLAQIGALVEHAPVWKDSVAVWRSGRENAATDGLRFRASCVRDGKHAYSSETIAGEVGAAVLKRQTGWTVSLVDFNVEVVALVLHHHVVLGLSLAENSKTVNFRGGRLAPEPCRLASLDYISTLRPSTAYMMLQLAKCDAGDVVLDCMCGVGTLPACAVLWGPSVFGIGGDVSSEAIAQAHVNFKCHRAAICQWSAEKLPLRPNSVDRILVDMPFGMRCGNPVKNARLYPKAIGDMARVLRPGGVAVLLAMSKKLVVHSVRLVPSLTIKEELQVNIGGLGVGLFVIQKNALMAPAPPSSAAKRKLEDTHDAPAPSEAAA
ncbi:hypothetical protein H310_13168 [Aphanomyces invadans]|uniref:Ribosomal RNA large subunit methyltransferase K/L-like methyltransferase domain-containing protein n=1 Tax=Aphanomyces invadans TaxID=157072 RepID=A0A024TEQ6_9STRA|nr:hypothetical protein H310_13168 [Aphanomyces invadans]ETV92479.1 hypothetical protein H310_13168 [Aphanomyces invadans]|eukprot:XP_008878786.1 hypothetical protein H310_13168 [Aphanomyces invadans]